MKKNLGYMGLGVLTIGVLLFLGKHSLNFFMFTFAGEDELYAWMGLLLTSIGAIIWLWIFKFTDGTRLQKTVALVMMFVALLGEFVTAGTDIYMQAMIRNGWTWTVEETRNMSVVISAFGLFTGLALVIHFTGDTIIEEFKKDRDGDGIPDFVEFKDNRPENVRQSSPARPGVWVPENLYDELKKEYPEHTITEAVGQGNGRVNPTQRQGQK